ncbi:MAG: Crp/Fnr family transcriptional regulator [Ruminococcus sp.]|nr:Crp/Fnr family transcriptional regulator [Candidatus Copronaster equi]
MDELIEKLPYWSSLNDAEKRTVRDSAIVNHYESGSTLHGNCDKGLSCLGMIYVISGELRAYILSEEGREITLFRLREDDSCVLSASCIISQISFNTLITATSNADVLIVPTAVFGKLINDNINVRCFMYELATERFSTVMWVMQQILFCRFDLRLATFLLNEYKLTGVTEIRMTQEQIAQNVNSAREVVARMLKQFALDGLIENQRGVIVLKDIDGLEKLQ